MEAEIPKTGVAHQLGAYLVGISKSMKVISNELEISCRTSVKETNRYMITTERELRMNGMLTEKKFSQKNHKGLKNKFY